MGRAPAAPGATAFRFTQKEVTEMERALEMSQGMTPARGVTLSLAENFTMSAERAGQKPIQWKQVWNWFQNRRHSQKSKVAKSPEKRKSVASVSEMPQPKRVPAPSAAVPSGAKIRNENQQMEFEAKSARDGAWYDVSTFISHRVAPSVDPEVRVRFAGFGSEEDEWVNVRNAVRQRSLPCEASECVAVLPGDLVLCFQEGNEQALYFDADILDVQRRRHDVRGCRCRFWVRYGHDQSEEVVPLRKVCRRPETEYRLQKLQSYGKNTLTPATEAAIPIFKPDPPPSMPNPSSESATLAATSGAPKESPDVQPEVPASLPGGPSEERPDAVMGEVSSSGMSGGAAPPPTAADAEQVHSAAEPGVSNATAASEQVFGVAQSAHEGKDPPPVPMDTASEPGRTFSSNEAPSLTAPPEMFDESDSIVVLDRSALGGINK